MAYTTLTEQELDIHFEKIVEPVKKIVESVQKLEV